nr:MAG TPA: hypothetical protein [Caudoviricetes sp.]
MGAESVAGSSDRSDYCPVDSSSNGYGVFPRFYLWQGRNSLFAWPPAFYG